MLNTQTVARIDGTKRGQHRKRRSQRKRKLSSSSKPNAARNQTRLQARALPTPAPALGSPHIAAESGSSFDDEFFNDNAPPFSANPASFGEEPSHVAETLTPRQLERRLWFRHHVKHLMAGMTAFTGFAVLLRIAHLG